MTSEYLKIVSVEQGKEISKIIRSTYGSLRYLLETVTPDQDIDDVLTQRAAHLLVIDNDVAGYSAAKIRLFKQTNAHLFIILISENIMIAEELKDCNLIKLISPKDLATKFPLILSEAYSDFTENIYSGLAYAKLLKYSLNKLSGIVIIANQQGDIVFLNQAAEEILGLDDDIYHDENLVSALVEGPKIWKYIVESCCKKETIEQTFMLKFFNTHQEILTRRIRIQAIEVEQKYFLLQEQFGADESPIPDQEMESDLLETFSESVANELLNPANVLSGRLQLMQAEIPDKDPLVKHVESISIQIQRIDEIIAKLLTFARLKQDFIPQKVNVNDILESVQLDPSISRLTQRTGIDISLTPEQNTPILSGQVAQFDLLFKMVLEICFNCLGTAGVLKLSVHSEKDVVKVHFTLTYPTDLYDDELSLQTYLGADQGLDKQKSIETTIIKQILQKYNANYRVIRPERNIEKLELNFPVSQSLS